MKPAPFDARVHRTIPSFRWNEASLLSHLGRLEAVFEETEATLHAALAMGLGVGDLVGFALGGAGILLDEGLSAPV